MTGGAKIAAHQLVILSDAAHLPLAEGTRLGLAQAGPFFFAIEAGKSPAQAGLFYLVTLGCVWRLEAGRRRGHYVLRGLFKLRAQL